MGKMIMTIGSELTLFFTYIRKDPLPKQPTQENILQNKVTLVAGRDGFPYLTSSG